MHGDLVLKGHYRALDGKMRLNNNFMLGCYIFCL